MPIVLSAFQPNAHHNRD